MMVSQSETDFAIIPKENVIWIDLFTPTGEEKRAVESYLGTTIQNRAQAEEIEISSRFSETEHAIFANTSFLIPGPDEYNEARLQARGGTRVRTLVWRSGRRVLLRRWRPERRDALA